MSWHPQDMKVDLGAFRNLLESRAMLEKKDFVSTGMLTYAEGDLFEIEISEWQLFHLGDNVKVTIYSPFGILTFESTVIARDSGGVMIINPPDIQRRFLDRRQHPRIDVSQAGTIQAIYQEPFRSKPLESPITLTVKDISLGGIGFLLQSGEREFLQTSHLGIELDLGFTMVSKAEIMRKSPSEEGVFYGAKFIEVPPDKMTSFRAFILRVQVEHYATQKGLRDYMDM